MFLQVPLTQQVESIIISVKGCADHSVLCVEKCLGKKRREYGCILCGKSIFSFKKNCQTISQSGCAIVRSHWQAGSHPASSSLSGVIATFHFSYSHRCDDSSSWFKFAFLQWLTMLNIFVFQCLYILDTSPLSALRFANTSSHQSLVCLFILLTESFTKQKFLILVRCKLQLFSLYESCFWC